MRKMQAELSFEDGSYRASRVIEQLSADTTDFVAPPMPRRHTMKVVCVECNKKFSTTKSIPECPRCHGTDVELA